MPPQVPRKDHHPDRKLGDEWLDWDGTVKDDTAETDSRVFIGLSFAATIVILAAGALAIWLIYPRLSQLGFLAVEVTMWLYAAVTVILLAWLTLFIWSSISGRPFFSSLIIIPKMVNLLLQITVRIGRIFGLSRDRLFNSFLKLHNLILGTGPRRVSSDRMLLLLPRCLTKETFQGLKAMKSRYDFHMATAGGGTEARQKIRELKPSLIIAIACERDLISGFIDVNPHIPVVGFPNRRPQGPCKNTTVDLSEVEQAVRRHLAGITA
jgi:hypothetical protein